MGRRRWMPTRVVVVTRRTQQTRRRSLGSMWEEEQGGPALPAHLAIGLPRLSANVMRLLEAQSSKSPMFAEGDRADAATVVGTPRDPAATSPGDGQIGPQAAVRGPEGKRERECGCDGPRQSPATRGGARTAVYVATDAREFSVAIPKQYVSCAVPQQGAAHSAQRTCCHSGGA